MSILDQWLVKAVAHPLRISILEFLHGGVSSPTVISRHLGRPLELVSYHVRVSAEVGAIDLVKKVRKRGAWEHFYVTAPGSMVGDQGWRDAPLAIRPGLTNAAVRRFFDLVAAAIDAETIEGRDDTTLSWTALTVDEKGWQETSELLRRTREILLGIHERSRDRLGGTAGIPLIAGLAAFEAARPAGEARPDR